MIGEFDLHGIFIPALLAWSVLALLANLLARRLLQHFGLYRLIWHRPLFDLALFVILLGLIAAIGTRILA
ncbi:DUF1656 domain-containing protein [Roseicella sp. DB1501]|uniref:DUF1656 domain-containing protein n=1 Tax=Roseicella sp. DB1501 TaxID=2730925 RepID=UPI001492D1E4|nr:DUF1656 domain-containing protein [Roseicella sp. DB1501]NOG71897.1 DUF1656 domain-containing protein [Roseicella sp. DB1501]